MKHFYSGFVFLIALSCNDHTFIEMKQAKQDKKLNKCLINETSPKIIMKNVSSFCFYEIEILRLFLFIHLQKHKKKLN